MKNKPPRDPIASFQRESTAARRVGCRKCVECGEDRPLALIPNSNPTICAFCDRKRRGRSSLDFHHPAGEANHPATVPVEVNDHRAILSPAQYEWPEETWRNPSGSPTRACAASIRGFCETTDYLAHQLLIRGAEMLEELDQFLTEKLGRNWWRGTRMEKYASKGKPQHQ